MEFKLGLVEKSYRSGACVAHIAREHGLNVILTRHLQTAFVS
ncbi:hypothetical protein RZD29_002737 [Citrobacter amalonaticus]|nr:hypothetical protein [Citrobacter amalonaticus]